MGARKLNFDAAGFGEALDGVVVVVKVEVARVPVRPIGEVVYVALLTCHLAPAGAPRDGQPRAHRQHSIERARAAASRSSSDVGDHIDVFEVLVCVGTRPERLINGPARGGVERRVGAAATSRWHLVARCVAETLPARDAGLARRLRGERGPRERTIEAQAAHGVREHTRTLVVCAKARLVQLKASGSKVGLRARRPTRATLGVEPWCAHEGRARPYHSVVGAGDARERALHCVGLEHHPLVEPVPCRRRIAANDLDVGQRALRGEGARHGEVLEHVQIRRARARGGRHGDVCGGDRLRSERVSGCTVAWEGDGWVGLGEEPLA